MIKGPIIYGFEWLGGKIKEGVTDMVVDYISALPIY